MALFSLGSISVADDGTVTKSGECGALFDALEASAQATAADYSVTLPTGAASAKRKRAQGRLATAIATYVHTALTTRAAVKVSTADAGLQRMPRVTTEDTECKAPSADKFLSIV